MGNETAECSGEGIKDSWEDSDLVKIGSSTLQAETEDLREARRDGGIRI